MSGRLLLVASMLALLVGCSGMSERDRSVARCERTIAQVPADEAAKSAMCGCIVDELAAKGMTVIDTLGNDEGKKVARTCASRHGVPMPNA